MDCVFLRRGGIPMKFFSQFNQLCLYFSSQRTGTSDRTASVPAITEEIGISAGGKSGLV